MVSAMEEERLNTTSEIKDQPATTLMCFNQAYKAWMSSLQRQLPDLHEDFELILDRLYVADANNPAYPMHVFQWYTGPYVVLMRARDAQFFDHIARESKGKSMPIAFKSHFSKLDASSQQRAWATLHYLMQLTTQVYSATYPK